MYNDDEASVKELNDLLKEAHRKWTMDGVIAGAEMVAKTVMDMISNGHNIKTIKNFCENEYKKIATCEEVIFGEIGKDKDV